MHSLLIGIRQQDCGRFAVVPKPFSPLQGVMDAGRWKLPKTSVTMLDINGSSSSSPSLSNFPPHSTLTVLCPRLKKPNNIGDARMHKVFQAKRWRQVMFEVIVHDSRAHIGSEEAEYRHVQ